jgi:A/G-specific adenine glycosylase
MTRTNEPVPTASPSTERLRIMDSQQRLRIHSLLLAWYAREGRHYLPWRQTRDSYAILVAEIMLQQTQVERVLPKYTSFLGRFPTIIALAKAPTAEVIRAWSGLGYNLRAVRLQEIARQVSEGYAGRLPRTLEELLALKGVGRYTAGAIACFAFELPVATVDTNIRRVLWRVFRGIEPALWPGGVREARDLISLAEWALPEDAYSWQQALMDLGATICLSRRPLCERCPLADSCQAYAETSRLTLFPSGEALAQFRDEKEKIGRAVAENAPHYAGAAAGPQASRQKKVERRKSAPFTQTSRYFRGRVVEILRRLTPEESLTMAELGPLLRTDFAGDTSSHAVWLVELVRGLARDGLVRLLGTDALPENGGAELWSHIRIGLP